ncbi:MAG TPA: tetratricopeptide repeat protein [Bryobacteraceae bacterium]|nr:tetratricopeptide repeat protein [Bryobacteraceae bacterium]
MFCCLFAAALLGIAGQNGLVPSPTETAKALPPGGNVPSTPAADHKQPLTREMRGDIFMARKMFREAVEQYKLAPQSANIDNKIGIAYHQLQDLRTAKKYYQLAIHENRTYPDAINNLGTVYYSEKSYRRAISQYKKALKIAPRSATIYSNLGSAYFSRKDYEHAMENYNIALSLDPQVFEHRGTTGVLLQERSVEDKAMYYYFMARVYAKQGDNDDALQYIRKALEVGFKDRRKFQENPDFAGLQKLPEFQQLMNTEQRVL